MNAPNLGLPRLLSHNVTSHALLNGESDFEPESGANHKPNQIQLNRRKWVRLTERVAAVQHA
jgi:hypothetical protein